MTHTIRKALERWHPMLTLLLATLIFDRLFFRMGPGVNVLLFTLMIVILTVQQRGWRGLSIVARWALAGTLLAAVMVVVHHTKLAVIVTVLSLCMASALAHEPRLRSLFYGGQQFTANAMLLPVSLWNGAGDLWPEGSTAGRSKAILRMGLLPALIGVVFFQLYITGNPRFDQLTAGMLEGVHEALDLFLKEVLTAHTLFLILGFAVCALLLRRHAPEVIVTWEQRWSDVLIRRRIQRAQWMPRRDMTPLERERRMGLVLLVIMNALLLVVNIIDINWVWFNFTVPDGFSLKQFVHEGTWMLILSILLSMALLLHLFRGNLNFHPRNRTLKHLALLWVAQNLILGVSVFLRNYHYISFHGLAYKRIGVIAFLALVLVGLITLYGKVLYRRSFFHLVRVNGWALFAVLVAMTTIDWDRLIVRYNLRHDNPGEIDIDNYLSMGDRVLPLLVANQEIVEAQMAKHRTNRVRWVDTLEPDQFRKALANKRRRFEERMEERRWPEWNWADMRTASALKSMP